MHIKLKELKNTLNHALSIINSFDSDQKICPKCGRKLTKNGFCEKLKQKYRCYHCSITPKHTGL